MKWVCITLNRESIKRAREIREFSNCDIYTIEKYLEDDLLPLKGGIKGSLKEIFENYDVIICIMAIGIIVRSITVNNRHKSVDPAVLCLSIDGKYIIPVLSGHLGGANDIAKIISSKTSAVPVITTASDLIGVKAVDIIAKEKGLKIASFKDAMEITSKMIEGSNIATVYQKNLQDYDFTDVDGIVYIGYEKSCKIPIPYSQLIPKNIVLGIGAKRGANYESIRDLVNRVLEEKNISIDAVKSIASIDLKKDEAGILRLSEVLNIPFNTYSVKELEAVEKFFKGSDFVKKVTGVSSVSMPCGYLESNRGECLQERVKDNGVTLSVWRIDDIYS